MDTNQLLPVSSRRRKKRTGIFYFLFLEQLADDDWFYSPKKDNERIYVFFMAEKLLTGTIQKPTGKKDSEVNIRKNQKEQTFLFPSRSQTPAWERRPMTKYTFPIRTSGTRRGLKGSSKNCPFARKL